MCYALLLATTAHASKPEYFTDEIDNEYRSLMKQVTALLPKTDLPLVYLPAFTPFNLLMPWFLIFGCEILSGSLWLKRSRKPKTNPLRTFGHNGELKHVGKTTNPLMARIRLLT